MYDMLYIYIMSYIVGAWCRILTYTLEYIHCISDMYTDVCRIYLWHRHIHDISETYIIYLTYTCIRTHIHYICTCMYTDKYTLYMTYRLICIHYISPLAHECSPTSFLPVFIYIYVSKSTYLYIYIPMYLYTYISVWIYIYI